MKTCTKCDKEQDDEAFAWKVKAKGTRQSHCKECHKSYSRSHYTENKKYYLEKSQRTSPKIKERNKQFIVSYLNEHPCVDCGETDIEVLQFDHIEMLRQMGGRISAYMLGSIQSLEREIAKCEIRCGNCHIRRTRNQMGWFRT